MSKLHYLYPVGRSLIYSLVRLWGTSEMRIRDVQGTGGKIKGGM